MPIDDEILDVLVTVRQGAAALQEVADADTAHRLARSVVRPLDEVLGPDDAEPAADGATLLELALTLTRARATGMVPPLAIEATAALQVLAAREEPDAVPQFADLQAHLPVTVQSQTDGPYLATNVPTITDWLGNPLPAPPQVALCRCGQSATKPFCDGTHAEAGFHAAKDPDRVPDRRETYVGQQVTVLDNRGLCQHSGLCTDRLATVFRAGQEPFVAPSGGRMDEIIRAARDCPSGALSVAIDGVEMRAETDRHDTRPPQIWVTKDGPYRLQGAIRLLDGNGADEPRDEGASLEHCALCRCGRSQNKPFCSGMHWYVGFADPSPEPDREPTIFEWAGGLPALTRMTRLFYEKHVPGDPLLAPLFATMSADHPERVAAWLGEVFCGPRAYSERYGGYTRMLSQHIGKGLTEDKRVRWVQLLLRSAHEAGLPNDPEFRSAFSSYIEWGSRLAVENSQADARPPERMPVPHWDWNTAAGPPGSRLSALAPAPPADDPVALPAVDEPVSFATHIRTLFRSRDRHSMKFAFDLWSYDDVSAHATAILTQVRSGSMPCDGAWATEWVETFDRWVQTGMAP